MPARLVEAQSGVLCYQPEAHGCRQKPVAAVVAARP